MNETWWNWYFFSKTNSNFATDHQFALLVICIKIFFFQQIIETDAFLKIFGHNFERTPVFTGFLIMQTFMKIPLATVLCVLLLLLITLCSANDNNSSKPRDKVSLFNQTL